MERTGYSMEKIINCAKLLLANTTAPLDQNLEMFIADYEEFGDDTDFQDMLEVLARICKEDFDISGFELFEVPHPSVYIFYNEKKKQMFDVCIDDFCKTGEYTCITYINDECDEVAANNIPEAIEKYNKEFLN